ncbi:MAG: DUF4198 domain-containing protein [Deltaproteobacteria bacterium]|nr:DUF4198 domain-containing protein [Deltaproteobacteria bacterium]
MKRNRKYGQLFIPLPAAIALMLTAPVVHAHNLWLNPADHFPQVGQTVDIGIGWGHKYRENRVDQEVTEDRVEEISAVDPEGVTVALERVSGSLFRLKIQKAGVYHVAARIKPGVFTTTPEGRKWADKKGVENPIKCTAFHICAKTLIIAGGGDRNLSGAVNQPLEVIPLENPAKLKKGDAFRVKVLYDGKPLPNFPVKAVYAGYEEPPPLPSREDTPAGNPEGKMSSDAAHKGAMTRYPVEATTDDNGETSLKLDRNGHWMINLSHRLPYPDPQTCDEKMVNAAFTFQVK